MAKHNWPDLRRRYFAGEWITLEAMAQDTGASISSIRKRSMDEGWNARRIVVERETEAKAMDRLTTRLAREAEKRIPSWLDLADAMKYKALQALTSQDLQFNGQEAIRAASEAVGIEARLLLPKEAQNGDSEQPGPRLAFTQINLTAGPGQATRLSAPAAMTEATDAQLISLLGQAPMAGRVVEAKDRDRPARRRKRAAKKAKRKSPPAPLRKIHVQKIYGKLAPPKAN